MRKSIKFCLGHPGISATLLASLLVGFSSQVTAQTAPPPGLDEYTKGEPAVSETIELDDYQSIKSKGGDGADQEAATDPSAGGLLGRAKITESKRDNGQVYRIELEHSSGSRQIIEENDSDGVIESTDNDIEETPNLPKWQLGSW